MQLFSLTIDDCTKSLKLNPQFTKGYFRRAEAYMMLEQFELALKDYETLI